MLLIKNEFTTKEGDVANLFNYNTLNISLLTQTKSLVIELDRKDSDTNSINTEMLFELETIFSWASNHVEIHSIIITSSKDIFSDGIDKSEIENMNDERIQKILLKLQNIIYSMFLLPQTVILDIKGGAYGCAAEFSIGADIRIADNSTEIIFNHLENAFIPMCGGIGFLSAVVSQSYARNWIYTGIAISEQQLLSSGYIYSVYEKTSAKLHNEILKIAQAIAKQAPIARMQTKRSLVEPILKLLNNTVEFEKNFAFAGMCTGDWKKKLASEKKGVLPQFTSPKDLALKLKKDKIESQNMKSYNGPTIVN